VPTGSNVDLNEAVKRLNAERIWNQIWSQSRSGLLAGLSAGAGLRGLLGLHNLIQRNVTQPSRSSYAPTVLRIPVGQEDEEGKKKAAAARLSSGAEKRAWKWWDDFTQHVGDTWSGRNAKNVWDVPLAYPLIIGGAGAGAYGGWKLTDYLMDTMRKSRLRQEAEQARQEYEEALLGKTASADADTLGDELDRLYTLAEKRANMPGALGGIALLYALATGLAGARFGYKLGKGRQDAAVARKAHEQSVRRLQSLRPPALYAKPVPVPRRPLAPSLTAPAEEQSDEELNQPGR